MTSLAGTGQLEATARMIVCQLRDEIDMATAPACEAELLTHLELEAELVIDCTELTFIDSSGLNMLLRVRMAARDRGGGLVVRNVPELCQRTFEVAGLAELLFEADG